MADAMAAEALYAARLLSGEMPEQIEDAFRAAGVTLFPADEGDLETDCTCPDWANPCKHVAAVYYLLGERFDADPFLMFELRGRTKEQIVEALRARRRRRRGPGDRSRGSGRDRGAARATRGGRRRGRRGAGPPPAGRHLGAGRAGRASPAEAFWTAPADPDALAVTFRPPQVDALPIKLLGAPPFWQEWPEFPARPSKRTGPSASAPSAWPTRGVRDGPPTPGTPGQPPRARGRATGHRPARRRQATPAARRPRNWWCSSSAATPCCGACDRELWRGSLLRVEGEQV